MRPRRLGVVLTFAAAIVLVAFGVQAGLGSPDSPDALGAALGQGADVADLMAQPSQARGGQDKEVGHTHAFDASKMTCISCHEDTGILVSKAAQLDESLHGTGDSYLRGTRASCAGCHGSEGAMARIRAGVPPHDPLVAGVPNPSPINCRTCHAIHTSYTDADWALEGGAAPLVLEMTGGTYDGGNGNLCANCHQIRNEVPVAMDGIIQFTTTRFGTHHGVEANMLLGEGGLLIAELESYHYAVDGTCSSCHMSEGAHTFEPELAECQSCHAGLDTFDRNGVQTEISGLLAEVKALLISSGIMNDENRSIPGAYPEGVASAMWNYMYVLEDGSLGVHNPDYARALLQSAKAALGG